MALAISSFRRKKKLNKIVEVVDKDDNFPFFKKIKM